MIRASIEGGGHVFSADLDPGSTAYVDADWIVADAPDAIPAIVADPAGRLGWCDGPAVTVPEGLDSETAAGLALLGVARAAAAVVEKCMPGTVEVWGGGIVAQVVRGFLADRTEITHSERAHPSAVVDTTGDPSRIEHATRRLIDLGTLVLAGETLGRRLTLELYPDIHVRGLRIVGVGHPLQSEIDWSALDVDESLLSILRSGLRVVGPRFEGSPNGGWYGISF